MEPHTHLVSHARSHEDGLLEKVQERSVQVEELHLLREAIAKCSAQTQVNAPQLCRPLVIDYLKRVQKLDRQYQFKLELDVSLPESRLPVFADLFFVCL